jgi:hypothetical protein
MSHTYKPGEHSGPLRTSSNYPFPILSLADYSLPSNIKQVFRLCKFYVLTSDVIGPAVHKLAESPVTEFQYHTKEPELEELYKKTFSQKLKIRQKLLQAVFDLFTYGNGFVSVYQKIQRYLICPHCKEGKRFKIQDIDWEFKRFEFVGKCPSCHRKVTFIRKDVEMPSIDKVGIVVWDPMQIEIETYKIIDKKVYFYVLSKTEYQKILSGDREYLYDIPWEFVIAAKENRKVRLNSENLFHFYTVMISNAYDGWGIPRMLSAFKALYYMQTLMRANEATSLGRINDLVVAFPEMGRDGMSPIESIGGSRWRSEVERIIKEWQKDPNFVGVTGFPIGVQSIFGNGRNMLITGEIDMVIRNILAAMGVTTDMIYAASNYSSMAVSNRMLANQLNLTRAKINEFLDFLVNRLNKINPDKFKKIEITLSEYETVDDVQETQMMMNLFQQNRLSLSTLLKRFRINYNKEVERIQDELEDMEKIDTTYMRNSSRAQGEAGLTSAGYQRQQNEMLTPQMPMAPQEGGGEAAPEQQNIEAVAMELAQRLMQLSPEEIEQQLDLIQQKSPELLEYTLYFMEQLSNQMAQQGSTEPQQQEAPQETYTEAENETFTQSGSERIRPPKKV